MTDKLIRLFSGMLIVAFLSALAAIWTGDGRFGGTAALFGVFGAWSLFSILFFKTTFPGDGS